MARPIRQNRELVNHGEVRICTAFSSDLGCMAAAWGMQGLRGIALGYRTQQAAYRALGCGGAAGVPGDEQQDLVDRLIAYARGNRDDFADIRIDGAGRTTFQQSVLERCRQVGWGRVITYGELALAAGFPGSARAVGSVMSQNRVPLVIPCHRVVAAGGSLGGFSAPNGLRMKRRLLTLEGALPREPLL